MNQRISNAIRSKELIIFYYDGGYRTVEPHCHGVSQEGSELLRAYQVAGYSRSGALPRWRLFDVCEMSGLTESGQHFDGPRPGYKHNDSAMERIFAQL